MMFPFISVNATTVIAKKSQPKLDEFHHHQTDTHHVEEMIKHEIEQKLVPYIYVNNDVIAWRTLSMNVKNYLTDQWKEGNLWGKNPSDAFEIKVGVPDTMTQKDVTDCILRLTVKVAINRPGEYTTMNFTQETMKP